MRLASNPPPAPDMMAVAADDDFAVEKLSQLCDGLAQQRPHSLHSVLNSLALIAPLLNAIPNVVFFLKDAQARYLLANLTLAKRCGFKTVAPLLGKTSADVFPAQLGAGYTEQDLRVLRHGVHIQDQLEMHLYSGRETGWCLTQKLALCDTQGKIIGMAGISHDLQEAKANHPAYQRLAALDDYIRRHYARQIALEELTALTGLSVAQIERYCKRIFHLTPRQMIHKVRLEKASALLAGDTPITDIALQCGYTDHSAFSRQFKAMTGSTPRDFRTSLHA
ncbi:helix-turn-helix domain-containing protein [Serratia rhizosphaerae]|uniref:AraC family transcriptional regulator n=1 Tax=unclassified Serratia (in: enterobacteria) TaxID=2647522 RepID=UPI000CF64454|nr:MULTISPECIES: AraC family transcriptional regulator [unclassified Serratia (in: enterobacteria)]MBU3891337.1 AraC family transcriptional regulator [Serratia rubidaea]AVJ17167.1 AraC family transcriptional regulator [Serratia sp. MYb239]MCA4823691.1 AraC family transcriptional regulator [Serratia rubidaea]QNK30912.1 AraC family transcriptional regulator [Serratia sp. JUb9]CAE1144903.1 AraC family transcriptional regulator [Serratia sp. Tan611]